MLRLGVSPPSPGQKRLFPQGIVKFERFAREKPTKVVKLLWATEDKDRRVHFTRRGSTHLESIVDLVDVLAESRVLEGITTEYVDNFAISVMELSRNQSVTMWEHEYRC